MDYDSSIRNRLQLHEPTFYMSKPQPILPLLVCSVFLFFTPGKVDATNYYPGDLSEKFKETEVFHLTSPSQVTRYFINSNNPQTGSLPNTINFTGDSIRLTDKIGIGIDNPLKNEPFYKIEVTLADTNQQNLTAYLTPIDNWWSSTTPTNGISVGINTNESKSTYWYWHTKFKNQGSLPDSEYLFSKNALARFSKRVTGDTKIEIYVTPLGSYAVINGANFASFPHLYIGSYIFQFTNPFNYITLAKRDQGGDPITFKNLRIVKLDNSVASVEEINAYFIKRTVESDAFTKLVTTTTSGNGTGGFQNALWISFLYRGYDYYFKTDHQALVQRYIDDYYLPGIKNYIDQNLPRYGTESTLSINHSFINSVQSNPYVVYAIASYLRPDQKLALQQQFARVIDKSEQYIKTDGTFPEKIKYKGDTFAEETDWLLAFYTGYYLNFPSDNPRSDKLLDYIAFLGFLSGSDGKSLSQVYGSTFNFKYLGNEYKNFVAQYIWSDGKIDNHQFHPSFNYGQGVVGQVAIARNGLQKLGINLLPLSYNTEKVYQAIIKDNLNVGDFHLLHTNPTFDTTNTTASLSQDQYVFAADGSVTTFHGHTQPSLVEDWGNVYTNYHIIENYGDYPLATQFAKNVYYGFYSGSGKLFCADTCNTDTTNMYNFIFSDSLYAMLFSRRSQFITSSLPGDLTGDGHVDLEDYQLLLGHFGNPYTIFDYSQLVENFGK